MAKKKPKVEEKKPYVCIERTFDIKVGNLVARLWIDITEFDPDGDPEDVVISKVKDCLTSHYKAAKAFIIDEIVAVVKHVNAVQITEDQFKDDVKEGVVVYTVDFDNNIKG